MTEKPKGWNPAPLTRPISADDMPRGSYGRSTSSSLAASWEGTEMTQNEGSVRNNAWGAPLLAPIGVFPPTRQQSEPIPASVSKDEEDDLIKEVFAVTSSPVEDSYIYSPFSPGSPLPVPVLHSRSLPSMMLAERPRPTPAADLFAFEEEPAPLHRALSEESRPHPGEQPSRTLFVRNVSALSDKELRAIFSEFGAIQNLYTASKNRGFVMVSFFDLRDADRAKLALNGKPAGDKVIDIHYSIPKDSAGKDPQQGFVFLPGASDEEQVRAAVTPYGDVKEIRDAPKAKGKIVEFFDVRQADSLLNHRLEVAGQLLLPKPVTVQNLRKAPPSPRARPIRPRSQSAIEAGGGAGVWAERQRDRRAPATPTPEQFVYSPERVRAGEDRRTTLMIKNIPNKYNQKMLLNTFEEQHRSAFDFIYLPIDFKNWCNVGYAFINFVHPEESIRFYENFNGKRWKHFNSEKICQISYARIQGKESLIDHFQQSNLLGEDKRCRPIIFEDGHPVQFPTRKVR